MKEKMVHTPAFEPDNLMETVLVQLPWMMFVMAMFMSIKA